MRRDDYLETMGDLLQRDADVYRAIVSDVHGAGSYLLQHKFRYLRLSYVLFLGAFALAGLQQFVTALVG